jgi:hypothetical protein
MKSEFLRRSATCALFAMLAGSAQAQQLAGNSSSPTSAQGAGGIETVVVTGTAFDPESAPAKASLETMEPQTIINKSYIEDSVSETADYTTILAIAPGMTGFDTNGPGLSDGGVKNTMRGLPDGSYGIAVHPVGNLGLVWDHRAVDGAYASAFLARIKEIIETRDWSAEL